MSLEALMERDAGRTADLDHGDINDSDNPAEHVGSGNTDEIIRRFGSLDRMMEIFDQTQTQLEQRTEEIEQYKLLLEKLHSDNETLAQLAEDKLSVSLKDNYSKDPYSTTSIMIRKAQDEIIHHLEQRVRGLLNGKEQSDDSVDDLLGRPDNAGLRNFKEELDFLIRDKGFQPKEAGRLLKKITEKSETSLRKRDDASRRIRNSSMVESDGEIGEPVDDEKKFHVALKRAKTLDDMFAALRNFKSKPSKK